MVLYDIIAPLYDPVLKRTYAPFRRRAFPLLEIPPGSTVMDLACGTGQNFSYLRTALEGYGRIIGVDISEGMLKRAVEPGKRQGRARVTLVHADATQLTPELLEKRAKVAAFDAVICAYGFTAMKNWEEAFRRSYALLKPGGTYFIHDIYAEKRTPHVKAFELATRVDLSRKSWEPLKALCPNFHFEYLDPSSHIFAGRLFVAVGVKPVAT